MPALTAKTRNRLIILVAAVVIGYGAGALFQNKSSAPAGLGGILLDAPRTLEHFTLVDHNKEPFTPKRLQGKWTFMFFGYTHCPDICPTTMLEVTNAQKQLKKQGQDVDNVQIVFVSVDPKRDDADQLKSFVGFFADDGSVVGATGTVERINELTDQVNIRHRRLLAKSSENFVEKPEYLVEHSAAVLLVDPQARVVARFSAPHYSEQISEKFLKIRQLQQKVI